MALSHAERQRRYRERRKAQQPPVHYRRPRDQRSRPQRWRDAVETLRALQEDYLWRLANKMTGFFARMHEYVEHHIFGGRGK